ncbi:InlB B-repeat-containing protein [Bifidobacterium asteroides]|uniref:RCC1 domain-containing protein n=1 Tax=Bifidobacterium asteroides TaxID=1684 RepID=UPI00349FD243
MFTDPEGGNSTFSQNVNDGSRAVRPTDPSRNGYLFDGWFISDTNGESKVAYDFSQPITSKTVLAAHWTKQSNTWSINPDNGPVTGNTTVNIIPPDHSRGIRFNQVSAGGEQANVIGFSLGVASDGNAYAWGNNQYGQLGQDPAKTTMQNTPTKVPLPDGVATGFTYTQVAAGGAHTLAIGSDGILYSWGRNDHGQLGDGTSTDRHKPQPVNNPDTGQSFKAMHISAGAFDSAAIDDQGRVYTWGCEHNSYSDYGTDKKAPTLAKDPNGSSQGLHAVQVSVKWSFILALDEDGNVYAWGYNTNGQLGNGTATGDGNASYANDPKPVQDPKDASKTFKATQISVGTRHALAIGKEDGSLYTWGKVNDTNYTRPTNDPANTGKTIKATQISAGTWHSLAIDQDGNAWGWGWNQYGQTGNGNTHSQDTPTKVIGPSSTGQGFKAVCISASHNHSLAIGQDGNAYAWGKNDYNQLGNTSIPTTGNSPKPIQTMFDPTPLNITGVRFDQTVIGALRQNTDGSVTLTTPAHNPGRADVIVDWTLGGIVQTKAHLAYTYEGMLPHAGSSGAIILLVTGLLAAAGAAAAGRHRQETRSLQA